MGNPLAVTDQWYSAPLGRSILTLEQAVLVEPMSRVRGDYLVQIGGNTALTKPFSERFRYPICVKPGLEKNPPEQCIVAEAHEMPFQPNLFDVVVAPHVLDFSDSPQALLSEWYLITRPYGYLMIMGFNPWSVWGLLAGWCESLQAWQKPFYSMSCVKRWLVETGFSILSVKTFALRPPFNNALLFEQWRWMEYLKRWGLQKAGGIYFIVAQKQLVSPTLRIVSWKPLRKPVARPYPETHSRRDG
ncbi:MAG TPA: methyltransferase domain-containing protein [Coxiellaceae bacterium]|nr:methyltransferase domain-containing protein [Coxiellaceae bacterium]